MSSHTGGTGPPFVSPPNALRVRSTREWTGRTCLGGMEEEGKKWKKGTKGEKRNFKSGG